VLKQRSVPTIGVLAFVTLLLVQSLCSASEPQIPTAKHTIQLGPLYEVSLEYFPNHSLKELTEAMPRLEKLGIKTIYLLPIFECQGGALYEISDYYKINPRYGNAEDLREMVSAAHRHDISILLDFVTSIVPEQSYVFTKHPEWLVHDAKGEMQRYYPVPEFGWAPDCTNPQVIEYYVKIAQYYVKEFDTDGWRVDSPADNYDVTKVPGDHSRTKMLRAMKAAIAEIKPSAIMIAELTGPAALVRELPVNATPLFDEMCDAAYNYPLIGFMGGSAPGDYHYVVPGPWGKWTPTILEKVVYNRGTSREFVEAVTQQPILYHRLRANFTENHDTARVSAGFPNQHRALFVLISSMPGFPVVHAGEELGEKTHPQALYPYAQVVDWNAGDKELEVFYSHVLKIRRENPALQDGTIEDVWKQGDNTIAFLRNSGDDHIIAALNFGSKDARSVLSIPGEKLKLKPESQYLLRDELSGESSKWKGKDLQSFELVLKPYGYQLISIKPI
jgi:cyclomaltodextrinase